MKLRRLAPIRGGAMVRLLKTYSSSTAAERPRHDHAGSPVCSGTKPTGWRLFRGCIRGTLDLSTVSIGDVVFDFLVCVDKSVVGQPCLSSSTSRHRGAKDAISADVENDAPPDSDNPGQ